MIIIIYITCEKILYSFSILTSKFKKQTNYKLNWVSFKKIIGLI